MSDEAKPKIKAKPIKRDKVAPVERTPEQLASIEAAQKTAKAKAAAVRTAQIANLMIAGHSLDDIAAQTGATRDEVEKMLTADAAVYVRTQPALRQWVRRYLASKYTDLLDAVWDQAVDKNHRDQLAYQDRARPLLDRMAKLYGADAPTQAEVKIETAPEGINAIVSRIAASQGLGYDVDIFSDDDDDVIDVDPDDVHEAAEEAHRALESAEHDNDGPQAQDPEEGL